nr:Gag-Pol polyprotein [Tanacetum cinerariifolium]
ALCYPKNDREDIRKLGAKHDIGFFIGYSSTSCAYRIYNQRIKKVMEIMNVIFDELSAMVLNNAVQNPSFKEGLLDTLSMYDDYISGQPSDATRTAFAASANLNHQTPNTLTTIDETALTPTNSSTKALAIPNTSQDVDELQQ